MLSYSNKILTERPNLGWAVLSPNGNSLLPASGLNRNYTKKPKEKHNLTKPMKRQKNHNGPHYSHRFIYIPILSCAGIDGPTVLHHIQCKVGSRCHATRSKGFIFPSPVLHGSHPISVLGSAPLKSLSDLSSSVL